MRTILRAFLAASLVLNGLGPAAAIEVRQTEGSKTPLAIVPLQLTVVAPGPSATAMPGLTQAVMPSAPVSIIVGSVSEAAPVVPVLPVMTALEPGRPTIEAGK